MKNLAMKYKIDAGEAFDVKDCSRTPAGHYVLESFRSDLDYLDSAQEAWIWSIGMHRQTGSILASLDSEFYRHPDYRCLYLR